VNHHISFELASTVFDDPFYCSAPVNTAQLAAFLVMQRLQVAVWSGAVLKISYTTTDFS
jgi:hypothetical protein